VVAAEKPKELFIHGADSQVPFLALTLLIACPGGKIASASALL